MSSPEEMVRDFLKSSRHMIIPSLTGHLWFSEKEWRILRDRGKDRTFGRLGDGKIIEYTEMITLEMLEENPGEVCGFGDAKYLGVGEFDHWEGYP